MVFTIRQKANRTSQSTMDSSILEALKAHINSTMQKNETTIHNVFDSVMQKNKFRMLSQGYVNNQINIWNHYGLNITTRSKPSRNNIMRSFKLFVKKYSGIKLFKGSSNTDFHNLNMKTNLIQSSIMNNSIDESQTYPVIANAQKQQTIKIQVLELKHMLLGLVINFYITPTSTKEYMDTSFILISSLHRGDHANSVTQFWNMANN